MFILAKKSKFILLLILTIACIVLINNPLKSKAGSLGVYGDYYAQSLIWQDIIPDPYALPTSDSDYGIEGVDYVADEVIVKFKEDKVNLSNIFGKKERETILSSKTPALQILGVNNDLLDILRPDNLALVKVQPGKTVKETITELLVNPNVESADPNYIPKSDSIPTNDTHRNKLWGLDNYGQSWGKANVDIDAVRAWQELGSARNVLVAVIDVEGIDYTHEDLVNINWWQSSNCYDPEGRYIKGGCYRGYNADKNGGTLLPDNNNNHGTAVSSVIVAERNNNKGILGIAPNVEFMFIKAYASWSITRAIDFARYNGVKIISISLLLSNDVAKKKAIGNFVNSGGLCILGSGNDGINIDNNSMYLVSSYNINGIISVGAHGSDNKIWNSFYSSNYGKKTVDLLAPGEDIYVADNYPKNSYEYVSGTSISAPYVAGVAAMVWGKEPNLTNLQVKERILKTGNPMVVTDNKHTVTDRRLNAYNALINCEPRSIDDLCEYNNVGCGYKTITGIDKCGKPFPKDFQIWCGDCDDDDGKQSECFDNKCRRCVPLSDADLCIKGNIQCGLGYITDNCNEGRILDCGDAEEVCPKVYPKYRKQGNEKWICSEKKCTIFVKAPGGLWDGGYYSTLRIGEQTWLHEDYNAGDMAQGSNNMVKSYDEKYCYDNNDDNCIKYGGLYQWAEAMDLPSRCNYEDCSDLIKEEHQGICPQGFHVPNDSDWHELEKNFACNGYLCDKDREDEWACSSAGVGFQILETTPRNPSMTYAPFYSGYRSTDPNSIFQNINMSIGFISAEQKDKDNAYIRLLKKDNELKINRISASKFNGNTLRCIADCSPKEPIWSDWHDIGKCGEIVPNEQKQLKYCEPGKCGGADCETSMQGRFIDCYSDDFDCGEDLIEYEGGPRKKDGKAGYYGVAKICDDYGGNCQCWFKDELNVGIMLTDSQWYNEKYEYGVFVNQFHKADDNIVQKACIDNVLSNCSKYGAFYPHKEARNWKLDTAQGLCPNGWHIPTRQDWEQLFRNVNVLEDTPSTKVNAYKLFSKEYIDPRFIDDLSGFDAHSENSAGFTISNKTWSAPQIYPRMFWSSTYEQSSNIPGIYVDVVSMWSCEVGENQDASIYTDNIGDSHEFRQIRCIKDSIEDLTPVDGYWSKWFNQGECSEFEQGMQYQKRTCIEPKNGGNPCEGDDFRKIACSNCGLIQYDGGVWHNWILSTGQETIDDLRNDNYRTVLYEGTNEHGISINQCWFKDSLNAGEIIPSLTTKDILIGRAEVSNFQDDDAKIERYCYGYEKEGQKLSPSWLITSNISEDALYYCAKKGGLYQWAEAMALPAYCNYQDCSAFINNQHQGICPNGWHIPTDREVHGLEIYFTDDPDDCDMSTEGYRCPGAGTKLLQDGLSGFNAEKGGLTYNEHKVFTPSSVEGDVSVFSNIDSIFHIWTADQAPWDMNKSISRWIEYNGNTGVMRTYEDKDFAMSVRCIKNSDCISYDDIRKSITEDLDKNIEVINDIGNIKDALDIYYNDYGVYPETMISGQSITDLQKMPLSPFVEPFDYQSNKLNYYYTPEYNNQSQVIDYELTYYLADGICEVPVGYYTATKNTVGIDISKETSQTTLEHPDSLEEQVAYIAEWIIDNAQNRPYSYEELLFISSPNMYIIVNGFDYVLNGIVK
ncbi:MAG: FISUMP domain-containing protein [bacterium]